MSEFLPLIWCKLHQNQGAKMSESRQNQAQKPAPTRYGKTLYESNPSITGRFPSRIISKKPTRGGTAYMVAGDGSGEVLGTGAFAFVEEKEIDSESFVKVYLEGIKQYGNLSKAGALLFEFVYREISGVNGKDKDTVTINYFLAEKWKPEMHRRTYERGMTELLEKGFLFRSVAADVYFVNVRFMFNGDRMVLVKSYRRAGSSLQAELPFVDQRELPAPAQGE
jgi:hypothetical protein